MRSDKSQRILKEIISVQIRNPKIADFNLDKNPDYPYYYFSNMFCCSGYACGGFVNEDGIHKIFMKKLYAEFDPAYRIKLYNSNTLKEVQVAFDLKVILKQ